MPAALAYTDDGDLVIGPRGAVLTTGLEAAANLIRGLFLTRAGEWPFDLSAGIAWRDFIIGNTDPATIAGYLADEVNAIPGVASVDPSNIRVTLDADTRRARIEVTVIYGSRSTELTFDTSLDSTNFALTA